MHITAEVVSSIVVLLRCVLHIICDKICYWLAPGKEFIWTLRLPNQEKKTDDNKIIEAHCSFENGVYTHITNNLYSCAMSAYVTQAILNAFYILYGFSYFARIPVWNC